MSEHHFHYRARWPGGRSGVGEIECGGLHTQVSIATSMDGPGVGTNPDEMLLGAAATCYLITLAAMIERAELPVTDLVLESEIVVGVERGAYECRRIVHRPRVTLAAEASTAQRDKLTYLLAMAERRCMISNALRGNVDMAIEPRVEQSR